MNVGLAMSLLASAWAVAGIGLLLITAFLYLPWIGFGEQGEVHFAAVSWLLYNGHDLYTAIDSATRYSIQHGPITYLINGAFMKVMGPGFVTAKIAGIVSLLFTIIISWLWYRRFVPTGIALLLLGLEVWILHHWNQIYYIRPDIKMLLVSTIGTCLVTTLTQRWGIIAGIAIPLGMIINMKIHGIIYFFPIFAIVFERFGNNYFRWYHVACGITLTTVLVIAPFLMAEISLIHYMNWLMTSVKQGILIGKIVDKLGMILLLISIPIAISMLAGINMRAFCRSHRWLLLSLAVTCSIVSVIGSKPGSGTNHLMPVLAVYMYILLLLYQEFIKNSPNSPPFSLKRGVKKVPLLVLTVAILAITISGINRNWNLMRVVLADENRPAIVQDIRMVAERYQGHTVAVGYGNQADYRLYRDFVPVPIFYGNPLLVETVGMGDMQSGGKPLPMATTQALADGAIAVWLIPNHGKPFDSPFDQTFRQSFIRHYRHAGATTYFDIWVHEKL